MPEKVTGTLMLEELFFFLVKGFLFLPSVQKFFTYRLVQVWMYTRFCGNTPLKTANDRIVDVSWIQLQFWITNSANHLLGFYNPDTNRYFDNSCTLKIIYLHKSYI